MAMATTVTIEFKRKMEVSGAEEECRPCRSRPICKLREQLHKVKVETAGDPFKTLIIDCAYLIPAGEGD